MKANCFLHMRNKVADQLRGDCAADQSICFRYIDSTYPSIKHLTIFYGFTAWFVSDLVGIPDDRISHDEADNGSIQIPVRQLFSKRAAAQSKPMNAII